MEAAAVFLVAIALLTRATTFLDKVEAHTSYPGSWVALAVVCVVMGMIEGRWWILLLAPLTWLVVWLPGSSAEVRAYSLVLGVPAVFLGLLVGVVIGWGLRAAMRRYGSRTSSPRVPRRP